MHRIRKAFLANGDFILPCVTSMLFSMLGVAFLAYGFSTADYYNAAETGQVVVLN